MSDAIDTVRAAERLSSICSLRPFTPEEAEEAVNVLLKIPALAAALAVVEERAEALEAALAVAREFVADEDWGEHAFLWQTQTIGVIDAALVPERTIVTNPPEDWPVDTFRERRR